MDLSSEDTTRLVIISESVAFKVKPSGMCVHKIKQM